MKSKNNIKIPKIILEKISKISYGNRSKKRLLVFEKMIDNNLKLSEEEFLMKYIDVTTSYERVKTFLSIFVIGFFLSFIFNTWNEMLVLIKGIVLYGANYLKDSKFDIETMYIGLLTETTLFIILITLLIYIVLNFFKLIKKKRVIEEIKELRENGKN